MPRLELSSLQHTYLPPGGSLQQSQDLLQLWQRLPALEDPATALCRPGPATRLDCSLADRNCGAGLAINLGLGEQQQADRWLSLADENTAWLVYPVLGGEKVTVLLGLGDQLHLPWTDPAATLLGRGWREALHQLNIDSEQVLIGIKL